MKTAELTGAALDWAVAHAQGLDYEIVDGTVVTGAKRYEANSAEKYFGCEFEEVYSPSTDWAQGGAIIEGEYMYLEYSGIWRAYCTQNGNSFLSVGSTPLIAAMRCYVASKLGDEVEIPEELEVTA
jgi:hypothetical protein